MNFRQSPRRESGSFVEMQAFVEYTQSNKGTCRKKPHKSVNLQLPQEAVSACFYKAVTKYFLDRAENNLPDFTCLFGESNRWLSEKAFSAFQSFFTLLWPSEGRHCVLLYCDSSASSLTCCPLPFSLPPKQNKKQINKHKLFCLPPY